MFTEKTIQNLVNQGSEEGFTSPLKGELKKYIVAYTNNKGIVDIKELHRQATIGNVVEFDNINIGGWTDTETGTKYIDISTSFNNLEHAKYWAKVWSQLAIWDGEAMEEIRI